MDVRNDKLDIKKDVWQEGYITCTQQEDGSSCGVFTMMVGGSA